MKHFRILIWHIHGSYLHSLMQVKNDWLLPVKPGNPVGYAGRGRTFDMPDWVLEVPADRVCDQQIDLVIYQTPDNLFIDGPELLGDRQWTIPSIYLEHNTPKPHPVDSVHPVAGIPMLVVHVTNYNRLMWNTLDLPVRVIGHTAVIDPAVQYLGQRSAGIVIANNIDRRGRATGFDLYQQARARLPIDLAGMGSAALGGLGDIPYRDLHRRAAEYRFLFSPMRYTSLPLSVIEAMHIGMPVVALATTELPSVIEDGVTGFISCDPEVLMQRMSTLLKDADLARNIGSNGREVARSRFGFDRFARDWNDAFEKARAVHAGPTSVLPVERSRTAVGSTVGERVP